MQMNIAKVYKVKFSITKTKSKDLKNKRMRKNRNKIKNMLGNPIIKDIFNIKEKEETLKLLKWSSHQEYYIQPSICLEINLKRKLVQN